MKRLSSDETHFFKRVYPRASLLLFSAITLSPLFTGGYGTSPLTPLAILGFGLVIVALAWIWFLSHLADEVFDAGDALVVHIGGERERILLSNVAKISFSRMVKPPHATVQLRKPCKFGTRVAFMPCRPQYSLDWANAVVEDLRARVAGARNAERPPPSGA